MRGEITGLDKKDISIAILKFVSNLLLAAFVGVVIYSCQFFIQNEYTKQDKQNEMNRMISQQIFDSTAVVNTASVDGADEFKSGDIEAIQAVYDAEKDAIQKLIMYRDMNVKAFDKYERDINEVQNAMNGLIEIIEEAKEKNKDVLSGNDFLAAQQRILDASVNLSNKCSEAIYFVS